MPYGVRALFAAERCQVEVVSSALTCHRVLKLEPTVHGDTVQLVSLPASLLLTYTLCMGTLCVLSCRWCRCHHHFWQPPASNTGGQQVQDTQGQ
jgi:hypothetical protein